MTRTTYNPIAKLAVLLLAAWLVPACTQPAHRTNTHRPLAARPAEHSGDQPLSLRQFVATNFPHLVNQQWRSPSEVRWVTSAYKCYKMSFDGKQALELELGRRNEAHSANQPLSLREFATATVPDVPKELQEFLIDSASASEVSTISYARYLCNFHAGLAIDLELERHAHSSD